jgi:REP element-mobilizing transposase RayT
MVIAYHLIMSAYGFWLPNDPRGSWSDTIRKWELFRYGPATKVATRQSVAHVSHDWAIREAAKEALAYKPVIFAPEQVLVIAQGFRNYIAKSGVTFWAVSILDDHLHALFMRHRYKSEQVANLLKGELTKALLEAGLHPFAEIATPGEAPPPCFSRKWWTVYIDNEDHLCQAIPYVERNPEKEGKPRQTWDFVVPYPLTFAEWSAQRRV